MCKFLYLLCFALPFLAMTGCAGAKVDGGAFGPINETVLLAPFAGEWHFNFENTLEALNETNPSRVDVDKERKLRADNPHNSIGHTDMTITGDLAVCAGTPSAEYRFFVMHKHGDKVCGKAWYHEDRYDPGDMTKCHIRMMIKDSNLHLDVRMQDNGFPDTNDPDLREHLQPVGGSPTTCRAENPEGLEWSEWTTFVFSRK